MFFQNFRSCGRSHSLKCDTHLVLWDCSSYLLLRSPAIALGFTIFGEGFFFFFFCAMECMCAQTRLQFILSPERVLGNWSGTGTRGQADTAEEVGLDRTHPQEASIQHHTPSPDLEPVGKEFVCLLVGWLLNIPATC